MARTMASPHSAGMRETASTSWSRAFRRTRPRSFDASPTRGPPVEQRRRHLQPDDRRRDARLHEASAITDQSQGLGESKAFLGFFFSPRGICDRSDVLRRVHQGTGPGRRTARSGVHRRCTRDLKYAAMRAASNVLLRDLNGRSSSRRCTGGERHLRRLHRLRRASPSLRPEPSSRSRPSTESMPRSPR